MQFWTLNQNCWGHNCAILQNSNNFQNCEDWFEDSPEKMAIQVQCDYTEERLREGKRWSEEVVDSESEEVRKWESEEILKWGEKVEEGGERV